MFKKFIFTVVIIGAIAAGVYYYYPEVIKPSYSINLIMDEAKGIAEGSPVLVQDFKVGEVGKIELKNKVVAVLEIEDQYQDKFQDNILVTVDSRAGVPSVIVAPGCTVSNQLPAGANINAIGSFSWRIRTELNKVLCQLTPLMSELSDTVEEILKTPEAKNLQNQFSGYFDRLKNSDPEEMRGWLKKNAEEFNRTTDELVDALEENGLIDEANKIKESSKKLLREALE